jgi:hypothetical protein
MQEAVVVGRPAGIPQDESPSPVEPRKRALDHPAMPAQWFLRLDAPTGDTALDTAHPAGVPALAIVVPLVRVGLSRAMTGPIGATVLQRGNCVQHILEELAVMNVRLGQADRERYSVGVDHNMALAARAAFVRWGPVILPPFGRHRRTVDGHPVPVDLGELLYLDQQ